MLLPSVFGENLFDDFMDDMFRPIEKRPLPMHNLMKTDIKELENTYELSIELPGIKKEDVTAELKDGYLTITAETKSETEEKGKFVRRERYIGKMTRSYFVGEGLTEEDIHAKFENGVLMIDLPKEAPKKIEEKKYIAIE